VSDLRRSIIIIQGKMRLRPSFFKSRGSSTVPPPKFSSGAQSHLLGTDRLSSPVLHSLLRDETAVFHTSSSKSNSPISRSSCVKQHSDHTEEESLKLRLTGDGLAATEAERFLPKRPNRPLNRRSCRPSGTWARTRLRPRANGMISSFTRMVSNIHMVRHRHFPEVPLRFKSEAAMTVIVIAL
jgi:hypothetical protein